MKAVIFFCLLCLSCIGTSSADDNAIDSIAKLIIMYFESIFKRNGTILLADSPSLTFNSKDVLEGTVNCNRIYLSGIENMEAAKTTTFHLDLSKKSLDFGMNITIAGDVAIHFENYNADLAIFNYVPIYGKNGNISVAFKSVELDFLATLIFDEKLKLPKFYVKPDLFWARLTLTQFWNNEELSNILSTIATLGMDALLIIWKLELDCISCGLGSIVQSLVNQENVLAMLQQRCEATCKNSEQHLIRQAFANNLTEFVESFTESDSRNYAETAMDYVMKLVEERI